MNFARVVYEANIGNTHEAALNAVWDAAYEAGKSEALANLQTQAAIAATLTTTPVASDPVL